MQKVAGGLFHLEAALGAPWAFVGTRTPRFFFGSGTFGRRFGARPVNDQNFSDMLNQGSVEFCADVIDHGGACGAIIAKNADLDQLMAFKADIDFMQNRRREAGVADHDYGIQGMGPRLEFAALCGIKSDHD